MVKKERKSYLRGRGEDVRARPVGRNRRRAAPPLRLPPRQRLVEQANDVGPPLSMPIDLLRRQAPVSEDQLGPRAPLVKLDGDDRRLVVGVPGDPGERQQRRRLDRQVLAVVLDAPSGRPSITIRNPPPTRGSTVTVAWVTSSGRIQCARLSESSHASNTRSRGTASCRRTTRTGAASSVTVIAPPPEDVSGETPPTPPAGYPRTCGSAPTTSTPPVTARR